MGLEEYCSFQTYNPNMLSTVEKRFRGIYEWMIPIINDISSSIDRL
jgi:hypothetical protein